MAYCNAGLCWAREPSAFREHWGQASGQAIETLHAQKRRSAHIQKLILKCKIDFRALKILSSVRDEHFLHKTQFARAKCTFARSKYDLLHSELWQRYNPISFQTDWWWSDQISVSDFMCKQKSHWIITINGKMNVWKCKLIFPTDTLQQKIEKLIFSWWKY